jgi:hypothetical protein
MTMGTHDTLQIPPTELELGERDTENPAGAGFRGRERRGACPPLTPRIAIRLDGC